MFMNYYNIVNSMLRTVPTQGGSTREGAAHLHSTLAVHNECLTPDRCLTPDFRRVPLVQQAHCERHIIVELTALVLPKP